MTNPRPILDVVPGDRAVLPTTIDGATTGPIVAECVREAPDGTVCVGWHTRGEDHELWLPLQLAARSPRPRRSSHDHPDPPHPQPPPRFL